MRLVGEHMHHRAVNLRASPAAFLVMEPAFVSDAGEDQAVANPFRRSLISRKPRDGSNRSWNEEEPIGVMKIAAREKLRQVSGHRQSGEIIVRQRRMTRM